MSVLCLQDDDGTVSLAVIPFREKSRIILNKDCQPEPLVQLKILGDDYPSYFSQGRTMRGGKSAFGFRYERQYVEAHAHGQNIHTVLRDPRGYVCTHILRTDSRSQSVEFTTELRNESEAPVTIEMLSSFTLGGLTPFGSGLCPERLVLHRMRSTWSAEGRLVSLPVEELQLEPSWQNFSANSIRFGSVGSFPVRGYVPFVCVEDQAEGVCWAVSLSHASSWQIEVCRKDNGLSLSGGIADREFGHWMKTLQPGERFSAPKAVITACVGTVDDAAQRLAGNIYKELSLPESEKDLPIIFNEFCTTWGSPTEKKVLEQLEALKGKGVVYYVIDAGWADSKGFGGGTNLGEWEIYEKAFPNGMKPVVDAIHRAGMGAGIWFEFEIAGRDSSCFQKTDWLLTRDGLPVTSGDRRFWDFRKPEVVEYLSRKVIDFLKENRFDYMKVDYNETIGIGCDGGDSLCDGLYEHILAVQEFFRLVRRELPDLVIELCASGGHRLVHSFLELTSMASFSDAHECDEIPIIAANMHRILPPRQSQIWVVLRKEQPVDKLYYQIASGLLGRLCFSGDIGELSPAHWAVIDEGIAFYRQAAPIIRKGVSRRFGSEIRSYRDPRGWQAVIRTGETGTLAVVHTFHDSPGSLELECPGQLTASFCPSNVRVRHEGQLLELSGVDDFTGAAFLIR